MAFFAVRRAAYVRVCARTPPLSPGGARARAECNSNPERKDQKGREHCDLFSLRDTGYDRSVFRGDMVSYICYMGCGKVPTIITQKSSESRMRERPKALQLSRPVRPSDPFSVAGTCMVRRATFNLLVQLRRRTSRPYSLELEHADARRFSTRCCLERRASPTPLASTTHTAMIWMISIPNFWIASGYPCGRLKPSTDRRRRWPDAGSRLDTPAFEGAPALTLADRG